MNLDTLLQTCQTCDTSNAIASKLLEKSTSRIFLKNIAGSSSALVTAAIASKSSHTHFIVFPDKEEAIYFYNDIEQLLKVKKSKILFFPHVENGETSKKSVNSNFNVVLRAETLKAIFQKEKAIIVSYTDAMLEKVVTEHYFKKNTLTVTLNEKISLDFVMELLIEYDFIRVDFVVEPGQFALRGGIIDIFSFANDHPFRIEFLDDEVHSLRSFDITTQLSIDVLSQIIIIPNFENTSVNETRESIFNLLPKNTVLWFNDLHLIQAGVKELYKKAVAITNDSFVHNHLINSDEFLKPICTFPTIEWGQKPHFDSFIIEYNFLPQPSFNKDFKLLLNNLKENKANGFTNIILSNNTKQMDRLYQIMKDLQEEDTEDILFHCIPIALHEGFIDKQNKICCYTDHQLFERYHRSRLNESFTKAIQKLTFKELVDLQPGDFVTHIDHGIGRFSGLEKIEVNGKPQEAIRLIYKDNDVLYVSIHSLHRISRYSGKESSPPRIDKLGTNTWKNLKQKTKNKVKELAFDLIALYAKRKTEKGFEFTPDTYLQHELEASFIFEDTPDQLKATVDVKKDMEASYPMDRLICGDVGFGKTEIAIRASFKAVTDSKQVVVLAPTTILTLQHYHTFKNRLKDFPCTIDYINRFKSSKQQKESIKNMSEGKTDIIIGTHRLLGKDVKYKDIGLIIIDEEQKFGVSAKDKLKLLQHNIDTLTLTATPIPRTLQFSLMGARDLSIINTPPPNRYPIHTSLHNFNEDIISDAIINEVSRQGQVFFVHNWVKNILSIKKIIERLCPDIRIAIGHGQMKGDELEKIMFDFIEGEYDVLLATTIIESGLDISNANTIIINNAHTFGLSDLHQLRGRVGRTNKKAFCYLLTPPLIELTNEARKRLKAIEQFTDLGSGFNIAMRDLDIRGAGNLLGGEQSGFINEMGFETYHKILDEAIQELKQDNFKEVFNDKLLPSVFVADCQIDTDMEILIPDTYIENISERLSLYKELDNIENDEALVEFEKHLIDRFGAIPLQTKELLNTVRLRWIAKETGFEKIILKNNRLLGYFINNQKSEYYQSDIFSKVLHFVQHTSNTCKMQESKDKLSISIENILNIEDAIAICSNIIKKDMSAIADMS